MSFYNNNEISYIEPYYVNIDTLDLNTSRINYQAILKIEKEKFKRESIQLLKESIAENFIREKLNENAI
jgi:hypothetical protein